MIRGIIERIRKAILIAMEEKGFSKYDYQLFFIKTTDLDLVRAINIAEKIGIEIGITIKYKGHEL